MPHITTPWTPEQVAMLNAHQANGHFHPYTCGGNRGDEAHKAYAKEHGGDWGQLVATIDGWVCPVCGYKQNWAHGVPFVDVLADILPASSAPPGNSNT